MNVDTNEIIGKLAEQIKTLTVEKATLQVACETMAKQHVENLNRIAELEKPKEVEEKA